MNRGKSSEQALAAVLTKHTTTQQVTTTTITAKHYSQQSVRMVRMLFTIFFQSILHTK